VVTGAAHPLGAEAWPQTAQLVQALLESRQHPEQAYRSCLGLLRLGSHYGEERLEAACRRALSAGIHSYKGVKNTWTPSSTRSSWTNHQPLFPLATKTFVAKPTTIEEVSLANSAVARQTGPTPLACFSCRSREQLHNPQYADLPFEDRLGLWSTASACTATTIASGDA